MGDDFNFDEYEAEEDVEMLASGGGDASGSSFSMNSGMRIHELEDGDGSRIEWWTEADVSVASLSSDRG